METGAAVTFNQYYQADEIVGVESSRLTLTNCNFSENESTSLVSDLLVTESRSSLPLNLEISDSIFEKTPCWECINIQIYSIIVNAVVSNTTFRDSEAIALVLDYKYGNFTIIDSTFDNVVSFINVRGSFKTKN